MKILVINGANMNMLGRREPDIYGKEDYAALCARIYEHAQSRGVAVECFQSNHEGAIIDAIQEADTAFDGIVINPAAYTHTSVAILDALKAAAMKPDQSLELLYILGIVDVQFTSLLAIRIRLIDSSIRNIHKILIIVFLLA